VPVDKADGETSGAEWGKPPALVGRGLQVLPVNQTASANSTDVSDRGLPFTFREARPKASLRLLR
jgi:hypothetical protein